MKNEFSLKQVYCILIAILLIGCNKNNDRNCYDLSNIENISNDDVRCLTWSLSDSIKDISIYKNLEGIKLYMSNDTILPKNIHLNAKLKEVELYETKSTYILKILNRLSVENNQIENLFFELDTLKILPLELSKFQKLTQLDIGFNTCSVQVPKELKKMHNLKIINIYNNPCKECMDVFKTNFPNATINFIVE